MKKFVIHHTVLLLCTLFLVQLLPVNAQDGNVLQNPGFEAPFNTLDGDPPRQVAQGWTPWHVPAAAGSPTFANRQPEYGPGTDRTLEGGDAQLISSFFATHDGGVYQRVTGVTPGDTLRFSISAYVWSSTADNEDSSTENGDVHVQVGIDPTGGTDPGSEAIVWSPEDVEEYDAYNEYSVEARAEADAVTVFVRTSIGVAVKNNNIYLDLSALTVTGEGTQEATAEATGETVDALTEEATEPSALVTETSAETEEASVEPSTEEAIVTEETAEAIPTEETAEAVTEEPTEEVATDEATAEPTELVAPTEDTMLLTATAIIADATTTASADLTATANVPTATATEDTAMLLTATAIIADATTTASADLTATANVPAATATEDPLFLTATAFIAEATNTAAANLTLTASVPIATATDDGLFLTATAIIADATSTAAVDLTSTANVPAATATTEATATATEPPISELFPESISHTVVRGDTVAILAQRYGSTVDAIAQSNGLDSSYFLQVGQVLVIPVAVAEAVEVEPTATTLVVTATPAGPVPALGTGNVYIVRPGDTLGRIARLFNTNVETLAQLNGIVNINQIQVGQQLMLPAEQQAQVSPEATPTTSAAPATPVPSARPQATYTVRPGDSLYKISLMFRVSISDIAQANNLSNRNRIYVGQTLIIP
jgi:LysM repeat protein